MIRRFSLVVLFILFFVASSGIENFKTIEGGRFKNEWISSVAGVAIQSNDETLTSSPCDCGPHSVSCSQQGNESVTCVCKPGYAQTNFSLEATCEECDCGENGTCDFKNNLKVCTCKYGFYKVSGYCQVLTGCGCDKNEECVFVDGEKKCYCREGFAAFLGKCIECDCGQNSTSCSYAVLFRVRNCDCKDGFAAKKQSLFNFNEYCEECDCGENGTCDFFNGAKRCKCNDGFQELHEKCQECDCGPDAISCKLGDNKVNECTCKEGFASRYFKKQKNEYCERCDCGRYGKCEYVENHKKCSCDNGYSEIRGRCQECDCGANSVFCEYGNFRSKKCTCKDGYLPFREEQEDSLDDYCKECNCGSGSFSCDFTSTGERRCNCSSGYLLRRDEGNEYCHYVYMFKEDDSISGWQIAVYVLAIFVAIIMVASLIAIVDRRKAKKRKREMIC